MKACRYRTASCINILQAFDKVWHQRLLYKIKDSFPIDLYAVMKPYTEGFTQNF
jgi:hypothetical protein